MERSGDRKLMKYSDLEKGQDAKAFESVAPSLWEWLTFSYLTPLLDKGFIRPLVFEDMPELDSHNTAEGTGCALADAWDEQLSREKPSLLKAMWKVQGTEFLWGNAYKVPHVQNFPDALIFVAPLLLQQIIAFIDPATTPEAELDKWRGPVLVACLFFSQCSQSLCLHRYFDKVYHCGMQARTGLMCLVFRKSMSLSSQVMNGDDEHNIGNIINMMQVDVGKCIEFLPFSSNLLWSSPVQILVSLALLWRLVGPASLAGFATILAVMPVNAVSMQVMENIQELNMAEKDKRIRTLSEILNGIKVLKMFAWEGPAAHNVQKIRASEVKQLRRSGYQMALQGILWQSTPALVALAIFGTYTAMGNTLSLSTALPVLSLITILKFPLTVLPWMLMSWVSFKISLARLEKFLLLPPMRDARQFLDGPPVHPSRAETDVMSYANGSGVDTPPVVKPSDRSAECVSSLPRQVAEKLGGKQNGNGNGGGGSMAAGNGDVGHALIGAEGEEIAIELEDVTLSWKENDSPVVRDVSFKVRRGELVVIMGDVGSGKSSLLSGILGEMHCRAGAISIRSREDRPRSGTEDAAADKVRLAYVPQVAWILDTTLRENVLMGKPWDAKAYRHAVHAAGLLPDLDVLPNGDETSIGERGVCLSGGQKQRVSLARAIYADADIYLLDDPLSAVDGHVAAHIYSECIHGAIERSTRVLVTHRSEVVNDARHVIVLKEGRIVGEGTWEELEEKGLILEPEKNTGSAQQGEGATEVSSAPVPQDGEYKAQQPSEDASYLSPGALGQEERKTGTVEAKTWRVYFDAIGNNICLSIIALAVATQAMTLSLGWCIAQWAAADTAPVEQRRDETDPVREGHRDSFLGLFALLTAAQVLATFCRDTAFVVGTAKAASFLHNRMLASILRTPLSFFDTTPSGVVLNRFSKDCDTADSQLPNNIHTILTMSLDIVGPLFLVGVFTPTALILSIPLFYLYIRVQRYYRCTCRELKRIESLIRSPIYSHFAQSLDGVISVRAYSMVSAFQKHHEKLVDALNAVYWPMTSLNRWLGLRLECIGSFIIALTCISAVSARIMGSVTHESGALLALTVTYVLGITHEMGWMVRQTSEAEANMNCVERMDEYSRLPSEPPEQEPDDVNLPVGWPVCGQVDFDQVCLRYRPELPLVLDHVSFTIEPGHKVGVCGRTGAGKSSLITMLLRLVPPESGRVCIDGVDIGRVGVKTLRSRLAIVPQDPIIYTGTLRYNLDPFEQFTDEQLMNAVKMVRLEHKITWLQQEVGQGGGELSVGERQLLCTARALLRKARIVLLDEATASVDVGTDQALQKALRLEGEGRTVITVAHRLNTIMDYDKVLVMAEGRVLEYANPRELARESSSAFAGLLRGRRHGNGEASTEPSPLSSTVARASPA